MESGFDYWAAKAALDWQLEMGIDECILDQPVDRYALKDVPKPSTKPTLPPAQSAAKTASLKSKHTDRYACYCALLSFGVSPDMMIT